MDDQVKVWRGERVLVGEQVLNSSYIFLSEKIFLGQVLSATVVVEGNTIKDVLPGKVEVPGALSIPHRVSTKALQVQWRWSTYLATAFSWRAWLTATFTSTSREEPLEKGKLASTTCKGCSEFRPILEFLIIIVLL